MPAASMRVSATGELLASLLQDERLGSRADEIAGVVAQQRNRVERTLAAREAELKVEHERELQLAVSREKAAGLGASGSAGVVEGCPGPAARERRVRRLAVG